MPVFEQLQILRERIGYWKSHERAGRLVLRVEPHVVSRVLGIYKVIMVPRCYGETVFAGIEWYVQGDRSVVGEPVRDVDEKYATRERYGCTYTLQHWIEKKPLCLAKMVLGRGEKYLREIRHCARNGVKPCGFILSWYCNEIPKIDLGRLELLLETCAAYVKWVDVEHLKAMRVVNRGL